MKLKNLNCHLLILLATFLLVIVKANGQTSLPQLQKLIGAVEANPDNLQAHENFIKSAGDNHQLLDEQYNKWMNRFPSSAIVPFAIGRKYSRQENPKGRNFLLKAVAIKPNLAEGWEYLWLDALFRGEDKSAREYIYKAAKADPGSPKYAFAYAVSYEKGNVAKYDSLSLDVVRRFPESEQAAQSLYWLAANSTNNSIKKAYYQQLYKLYAATQTDWAQRGMDAYFDLLINTDAEKAFEFALTMLAPLKTRLLGWQHKLEVARSFVNAHDLLKMQKPQEARDILKSVKLKDSFSQSFIEADETLLLLKSEAAVAGNLVQAGYDSVVRYYSQKPSDRLYAALVKYGSKLGKDSAAIKDEIAKIRLAAAPVASPFTLESYVDNKKVSLSDFKGKVVLLTFWFPGCGPCREEFPHFESALKKFNTDEVAYLGINGLRDQDDFVIPFMNATKYSFIPLKEDINRNNQNLRARGFPTNFLIDQQGRVVFSNFRIGKSNERTLELMIRELLEAEKE